MTEAWIIDACRTPRGAGKVGKGSLAHLHTQRLGATVLAALAERTGLDTKDVDDVIFGCSWQVGTQSGDLGRMAALDAGYPINSGHNNLRSPLGGQTERQLTAAQYAQIASVGGLAGIGSATTTTTSALDPGSTTSTTTEVIGEVPGPPPDGQQCG